eukprot:Hpha_TRINITY_DN18713_c0_g1::TRINITY_DN18713_c0_g1_i1::g.47571::m.47571
MQGVSLWGVCLRVARPLHGTLPNPGVLHGGQRRWKGQLANIGAAQTSKQKKDIRHVQRKKDPYYAQAKREGMRARSAYKLLQLNKKHSFISPATKAVVDLGCAPGGWLMAAAKDMKFVAGDNKHLIGVDLQSTAPLPGVSLVRGDFTDPGVQQQVLDLVRGIDPKAASDAVKDREFDLQAKAQALSPASTGNLDFYKVSNNSEAVLQLEHLERGHGAQVLPPPLVDVVISDLAPNVGAQSKQANTAAQLFLVYSARSFAIRVLRRGGTFVTKVYMAADASQPLLESLALYFEQVHVSRPDAVRGGAHEAYAVCKGYIGRERVQRQAFANIVETQDRAKHLPFMPPHTGYDVSTVDSYDATKAQYDYLYGPKSTLYRYGNRPRTISERLRAKKVPGGGAGMPDHIRQEALQRAPRTGTLGIV